MDFLILSLSKDKPRVTVATTICMVGYDNGLICHFT